jgi:molecular chaperone GrpE (heat shock protein)
MKTTKEYSSPLRKLVKFFKESRDRWKAKYQQVHEVVRRLQGRIRSLQRSRDHWKEQAKRAQAELTNQKTRPRPGRAWDQPVRSITP